MKADEMKKVEERFGVTYILNAIKFKPEFKLVMSYCFGNFFICKNYDIGVKLQEAGYSSVTIEGDIIRASGIMTGGAKPKIANHIKLSQQLRRMYQKIKNIEYSKNEVKEQYEVILSEKKQLHTLREDLEEK